MVVTRGATQAVALFCFVASSLFLLSARADPAQCGVKQYDETVQVNFVYDGDTIELTDKRRVRFLGINAPEVAHKKKAGQPFGNEAAQRLQQWLPKNTTVGLVYDEERHDKYGRLLAHVFVDGSESVNARLLTAGLAMTLVVPPNQKFLTCYDDAEQRARDKNAGLWALKSYQPQPVKSLGKGNDGFAIVTGVVRAVGASRDSVWINYDGNLALRILKKDIHYFAAVPLDNLAGKVVRARGWIYPSRRGLRMQIRHPAALEIEPF